MTNELDFVAAVELEITSSELSDISTIVKLLKEKGIVTDFPTEVRNLLKLGIECRSQLIKHGKAEFVELGILKPRESYVQTENEGSTVSAD